MLLDRAVARRLYPYVFLLIALIGTISPTAFAQDPADSVCQRFSAGSQITEPQELASQNGTLEVTFKFQTAVDANGLTRYCYVTDTGLESPTLVVNPGDKLIIHFQNNLPASQTSAQQMPGMKMHLSDNAANATGSTSDTACNATTMSATSTNLHFHGFNAPPTCHQDEVIHTLIQPQQTFDYTVQIPANEPPGLYWYHPHPHGFSEAQVLGGASGAIIVQGIQNFNTSLAGLPEKIFVLRDQQVPGKAANYFPKDLSLNYVPITASANTPAVIQTAPSEKEFWRVLNASADTLMDLQVLVDGVAQQLTIMAIDGVPLKDSNGNPAPVTKTDFVLPSASRVEFVLTTPASGQQAQLVTKTWDNGPDGDADPGRTLATIQPTGNSTTSTATTAQMAQARKLPQTTHPLAITRFAALDTTTPATQRTLYFSTNSDFSQFYLTIDGQTPAVFDMNAPPSLVVQDGTTEQWTIQNRSRMDHSFHIHQIHFQTLAINGQAVNDTTLRDTIDIPHWSGNASDPYPSVTLLMDFRDPNIVGTFVYHCHILSHEDLGMMQAIQVNPASTTTALTASPTSATLGSTVTLTATVTGAGTTSPPAGTVTFLNGTTTLGTANLDSSGTATFTTTALPLGASSITAQYAGDTSFTGSTSPAVTVTMTPATTTTALTASATTVTSGANVTFTATVTASNSAVPTGSVTFLNGTTALGTTTLNGSGVATYTTNALPVGSDSITAQYAAATSFAASTSAAVVLTVNAPPPADFTVNANPTSMTLAQGQSAATTLTVTPANGFSSQVSFSCSGLPSAAQCSFSPQTVTPDGTNAASTQLTITTTASSALLRASSARTLYALILPGFGMILAFIAPKKGRLSDRMRLFCAVLSLSLIAFGAVACGGGSSSPPGNPGTPAGTSTVTVTATGAGTTATSHTATFTLTVSQ